MTLARDESALTVGEMETKTVFGSEFADNKSLAVDSPPQTPTVGPPPDGGFEAWACATSASFVTFCLMGFVCSFGQLQEYYLHNQLSNYSKSTVAWIGSAQATEVFIFSVIWGRIFDAYGARPLVWGGTTLSVAAVIAMAFCKEYYQFFLAHFLFGFASGMIWPTVTAVGGHWFSTRRGAAIGLIVGGSGGGGIVYPIMLRNLFQKMSFRNTLLIVAAMNAGLMLPSWLLLKSRLPKRKPVPLAALAHPWRDTRYAFFVIGCGFYMFNWMSPMFDAPIIARANNVSEAVFDYSVAIVSAGGLIGRTIAGVLADRFGVWNVFGTTSFLTVVCLFGFFVPSPISSGAVAAGFAIYGGLSGAWLTLVTAVIASISPVEEVGLRIGIAWSVCGPFMIAGPVICGALIQNDNNRFSHAAIFCGFTFLIASLLAVGPRMVQVIRQYLPGSKKSNNESSNNV